MLKKILCFIIAVSLIALTGCALVSKAQESSTTTPASVTSVREAKIGKTLMMRQMEIGLDSPVSIVITLSENNVVDGYFYLVKGDSISFTITGISAMYTSQPTDTATGRVTSDRFSFASSQAQGLYYTLTLKPATGTNGKSSPTTVFLEVIYPATGSIYVPFGTK
jgi:hypothetical protein